MSTLFTGRRGPHTGNCRSNARHTNGLVIIKTLSENPSYHTFPKAGSTLFCKEKQWRFYKTCQFKFETVSK